jgi:D-3-phosphoglycerate dehydrogenase/(S)-sulfolactate dehydrogenase
VAAGDAAGVDLKSLGDMARSAAESIVGIFKGEWLEGKVVNSEVRTAFPANGAT